ncbi:hypothetical protein NEOKW01_1329 [Nematocida sp. AWRm80]|nr:hypothetical protein NEOKW01_1329 [Nematocida sp. AWRm80]
MEQKKKYYEDEISNILRYILELSYRRKKNAEQITYMLKLLRNEEPDRPNTAEGLINEYTHLKKETLLLLGEETVATEDISSKDSLKTVK